MAVNVKANFVFSSLGLAFLAGIGLMIGNIAPTIVTAYVDNPTFSVGNAGSVISVNMFGTALGALITSFLLQKINWSRTAFFFLLVLVVSDLISIPINQPISLFLIRFIHGLSAGALMGITYAAIAQTSSPERIQALSYTMQLLFGGILIQLITPRIESVGVAIVWLPLVLFSAAGLLLCRLLKNRIPSEILLTGGQSQKRAGNLIIGLALVSLFAFQMGQFAAFAYVIEVGINHNFSVEFTGASVAMGMWVGGPSALFVTWWSLRSGRAFPIVFASGIQIAAISLLLLPISSFFLIGNIAWGIAFNIGISYVLGLISELDNEGRIASLAAFMSTLGLSAGPGFAAFMVGEDSYERVLLFSLAILFTSLVLIIIPAMKLDSLNKTSRIIWS